MKSLFIVVFALISQFALGQPRIITGTTLDAKTGEAIGFCTLVVENDKSGGTLSDAAGSFSLRVPVTENKQFLKITSVGYETVRIEIVKHQSHYMIVLTEENRMLEEVAITGSTKQTAIRENPLPIALVTFKEITATPQSNLIESLVRHVPGLSTVTTGPNISKPFIRGLGYNRVLTLYDNFRQEGQQWGDEHGIEVDNYNIERAEVIRGPASLLYGSDALAGVVSLFPFVPRDKDGKIHGQVLSEYQSNNGLFGEGIRVGISSVRSFWSVSTSIRKAKNYTNKIDGPVYNTGFEEKNLTAQFGLTNAKGESKFNFTLYDDLQGIPDGSRDSLTRMFTKQIYEGTSDTLKKRPVVSREELGSYALSALHQHIQHYRLYTSHQYLIGKNDVDIQLGVQQNIRREFNHPTRPDQPGLFVRLNTLNYGIRWNTPEFSGLQLTGGVNGMLQQNKNKKATDFPVPDYTLLDGGGYGFFIWKKKKWTTSGGIRYDLRKIKSQDFYTKANPENNFLTQAHFPDTVGATLQSTALHQNFNGISLSLGTTVQLSENWSMKFNAARGYRAPNIAEIASNGLDPGAHIVYLGNRNFQPEFNFQEDFSLAGDLHDFSVTLSFFNNTIHNYIHLNQVVDAKGDPVVLVQGNKTFQYVQSSAHLYGTEGTFDWHPQVLKGFSISSNIGVVFGNNTDRQYQGKGVQGHYLPFIPPLRVLNSIRHELFFRSSVFQSLTLGTDVDFTGSQNKYLALYSTETRTPGYALINVSIGTYVRYSKARVMQVYFQINNVFDQSWQSNLSRLKYFEYYRTSPNGKSGMYGPGRNLCLKIVVPF